MTIVVTRNAAQQILISTGEGGQQGTFLRVAAKRNQRGGIEYAMGFDEQQKDDAQVHWYGVTVLVAPTSTELLSGSTLDYVELDDGSHGFIFLNPNDPEFVPPKDEG